MSKIKFIECFFKMPFEKVISDLHWANEISLNELSKRCSVPRQTITNICDKLGLKYRTVKQATAITKNKGHNHFMKGKNKSNDLLAFKSSLRMKNKNPILDLETRSKAAITRAKFFSKNLLPQEKLALNFLKKLAVSFKIQYPISGYIIDFFIPEKSLCIEIDSVSKWGLKRKKSAKIKDDFLLSLGFKVVRLDKNKLSIELFRNILNANDIVCK